MFSPIKQVFIVLLRSSITSKFISLKDKPFMVRIALIDLNPVELKYYPFIISLNKFNGSFNVSISISKNMCSKKNDKVFKIIKNKNKAKTMAKHISCDCKCKFNSTNCNYNKKI